MEHLPIHVVCLVEERETGRCRLELRRYKNGAVERKENMLWGGGGESMGNGLAGVMGWDHLGLPVVKARGIEHSLERGGFLRKD